MPLTITGINPNLPRFGSWNAPQKTALNQLVQTIEDSLEIPVAAPPISTNPIAEVKEDPKILKMQQWLKETGIGRRGDHTTMAITTLKLIRETGYQMTDREKASYEEKVRMVGLDDPFRDLDPHKQHSRPLEYTLEDVDQFLVERLKHVKNHLEMQNFIAVVEKRADFEASAELFQAAKAKLEDFHSKLRSPAHNRAYTQGYFEKFTSQAKITGDIRTVLQDLAPEMTEPQVQEMLTLAAKRYQYLAYAGRMQNGEVFLITEKDSYYTNGGERFRLYVGQPGSLREVPSTGSTQAGNELWLTFGDYQFHSPGQFYSGTQGVSKMNDTPVVREFNCLALKKK